MKTGLTLLSDKPCTKIRPYAHAYMKKLGRDCHVTYNRAVSKSYNVC